MKTGSFLLYAGPGRISIAQRAPRGTPAGFRVFPALAPGRWFNQVDQATYRRLYFEMLGRLDPQRTWDALHEMVGCAEPVLMCWEKPPFTATNWCHRRMVAVWLNEQLGHEVDELPRAATVLSQPDRPR
jgi:hypothetical protein